MHRIRWSDVPDDVRADLERALGSAVRRTCDVEGGFSPCLAAVAELADGRRVFVKAVSPAQNPDTPSMLRRELAYAAHLPPAVPAPRLLAVVDDGVWIAGAFDCVVGHMPQLPWPPRELSRVLGALEGLSELPAPVGWPPARDRLAPLFDGWRRLQKEPPASGGWWWRELETLVALEQRALAAFDGDRLVHNDVRADNLLLCDDGRVVLVDWAHPCAGPAWLDLVLWLPALELEGGGAPEAVLARARYTHSAGEDDVTAVVAGCAGYFLQRSRLPDPPGLPTLRAFQAAQAETSLAWLARRLAVRQ